MVRMTVLVTVAAGTCACTAVTRGGATSTTPASGLPSISSVSGDRFVTTVDLDDGGLVVQPPGNARPKVPASAANTIFRAADAVAGDYRFALLGVGLVTLDAGQTGTTSAPSTSPATNTTTPDDAPPGTTTTVARAVTTTTTTPGPARAPTTAVPAAPTTTETAPTTTAPVAPTTSGPPAVSLPRYDGRLAWVGIVWDPRCASATTTSGGPRPGAYVAVIFDADTGRDVLAYTSRGATGCDGTVEPAHAEVPDELVSVAWSVVGPSSTAVTVSLPACGAYYGWTELLGAHSTALQVVARQPFDPGCDSPPQTTQTVDNVVPLGQGQVQILHASLGPVDELHTLVPG